MYRMHDIVCRALLSPYAKLIECYLSVRIIQHLPLNGSPVVGKESEENPNKLDALLS